MEHASSDPGLARPDAPTDPQNDESRAPGLREQLAATVAAIRRLVRAHVDLGKAELADIVDEVKRLVTLVGIALGLAFLAGLLVGIGGLLFLGEWIFGSIGWGVLLGSLLLLDVALGAVLIGLGISRGALVRDAIIALVIGIIVGVLFGLNLTNRGWTAIGDAVLPGVDPGVRPLVTAVAALAIVGGLVGLVAGFRGGVGGAIGGLVAGAVVGAILGAITATALGPRVGAAFGVLVALVAWPALAGSRVARTGIDGEALKNRFIPNQTIDTTKETIEWVRAQTPLGRRS